MERYNEYKDSGVQWLGEIPSHWEVVRLKSVIKDSQSGVWGEDPKHDGSDTLCLRVADFNYNNGYLKEDNLTYRNYGKELSSNKQLQMRDLLLEKSGGGDLYPVGRVVRYNFNGIVATCSNFIQKLTPRDNVDSDFIYYLFRTMYYLKVNGLYYNQTTGIQNLKVKEYLSQTVFLPPLSEQQAIANYLDTATAKIDEAIAQQQKMIDLLNERKQIIINNAVTKGLNPDAPMKDSGVDWIGEICKNWRMYRLKHLLKTNLMYGANESAESEETSYPRYIRITDIDENGKLKPDTFRSLEPLKAEPYLLTRGDILFARSGATAGKTYLFDEDIKACFAGYLIKAQVSNKLLSRYLMYYTRSGIYDQWKNSIFIQATIQNIGADKYANLRIPLPTIEEQKTIVSYLDTETMKIDKVLDTHKRQISLLQERKQIIINDVVTGKVKVS